MNDLDLKRHIRSIPNFPKPGIMFRDITTLLAEPTAFHEVIDRFVAHFRDRGVTAVVAAEARGFIFAAPLALQLNAKFIPVRKPGKLPFQTQAFSYELEYGSDTLHMHVDALSSSDRVVIVDDLLATGGTMLACVNLVEQLHATIAGCAFVIELDFLKGREKLSRYDVFSLVRYADET